MPDAAYHRERERMVAEQIAARGIRDRPVLAAMRTVPRERFVPDELRDQAYHDGPLPIGEGQTISQPAIVAEMIAVAELSPSARVLEIGAGSGYAAAVLSRVAGEVFAIERHASLAAAARRRLAELGYENVKLYTGDGSAGWADAAPFDAILVAAGGPGLPQALLGQLELGGRLVMPVGPPGRQRLIKATRTRADRWEEQDLGVVSFVPLIGEQGWSEDEVRD